MTVVFPCFFLSCKANSKVKPAKMWHGPHSSKLFVLFYVLFLCVCRSVYCLCVNVYCTATGWLPTCSLQICHIISIHVSYIISYHITLHHITSHDIWYDIIYHIMSCHISYHIIYLIISHHIYRIVSHISYNIIYQTSYLSYHDVICHWSLSGSWVLNTFNISLYISLLL
jgi:hypothetical protein